jgi:SAM-dependent methyltransferase
MSDDSELKAKHAKMWASGDYPSMVETFLLPLGPRLIEAAGIGPGQRVLDIAAGTGNASLVAAATGADVVASDLTPELLDAGRARADAENLPFEDESFDVVMSSIGIMFAPHHEVAASEMARVCKPGGTIALLSWTPEGQIGALFRTMKPFAPPPPPGAQPPPLWGNEEHLDKLFGDRVAWQSHEQATLPLTQFQHAHDWADHFKSFYGPTISTLNNARNNGQEDEFNAAFDAFADEWNKGTDEKAYFEQDYLISIGTRT